MLRFEAKKKKPSVGVGVAFLYPFHKMGGRNIVDQANSTGVFKNLYLGILSMKIYFKVPPKMFRGWQLFF